MLGTSIFSFFRNVFYIFQNKFSFSIPFNLLCANAFNLDWSQILLFGKSLKCSYCKEFSFSHALLHSITKFNPFPNKAWFLCVFSTSLLKTLWENEKLLLTVFSTFLENFVISSNLKLSSSNSFSLEES